MLLSEAIKIGASLRPEGRGGPFSRIANTEELRSDVWGAACEAVFSPIAKRNWNRSNSLSYDADIEALREIQQHYFARYFSIPVTCSGARPRSVSHAGGRFTGRVVQGLNEIVIEGERVKSIGGITDKCPSISNFAEYIEHAFYVHNWSREQCAEAAEFIEQGDAPRLVQTFEHYQDLSIVQRANRRLTIAARERERQRRARRQGQRVFLTN